MRTPLLLVGLATLSAVPPAAGAPRPETVVPCAQHIESVDPRPKPFRPDWRHDVVAPGVVLNGLRRYATPSVDVPRSADAPTDTVLKAAVQFRRGRGLTLSVAPADRSWLALDYDRDEWHTGSRRVTRGAGQSIVRLERCPPTKPRFDRKGPLGPWTAYAGGVLLGRAGCGRIDIWLDERARPLRRVVAFGVRPARCRPAQG